MGKLSPLSESRFPYLKNERVAQMVCKASLVSNESDQVPQFTWEGPCLCPLPSKVINCASLMPSKMPPFA